MVTLAPGGLDFGTGSVPRLAPGPLNPHLPEALPIMKFSHPGRLAGLCTTLFLLLAVTPVQATQLVQQNLTQLISAAETIISGRVTKVTDGFTQNGIPYTEVTIAVSGAAKGADAVRAPDEAPGRHVDPASVRIELGVEDRDAHGEPRGRSGWREGRRQEEEREKGRGKKSPHRCTPFARGGAVAPKRESPGARAAGRAPRGGDPAGGAPRGGLPGSRSSTMMH